MQREARVGKNNAGVFESCGWDSLLEMDFREFSMGYIYIYIYVGYGGERKGYKKWPRFV